MPVDDPREAGDGGRRSATGRLVTLVPADNPGPYTGAGNNTWLLDGDEPTLIDAGAGVPSHVSGLQAVLGGRALRRIIVTHGHPDHASGVPALRAVWSDVEVCRFASAAPDGAPPATRASGLHHQPAGVLHRSGDDGDGEIALAEGAAVRAGNRVLQVIHTPGHAPDHVCLWDPSTRELFGGDMLIRPGTVLIPAGHGGSLRQYLDSLRRIAGLSPTRVYPGHGPIIENPLEVVAEYLEQRRRREEQVLEAVAMGEADAASIVARLYPSLSDGLERAATMTIQAHLDKLREEGRLP